MQLNNAKPNTESRTHKAAAWIKGLQTLALGLLGSATALAGAEFMGVNPLEKFFPAARVQQFQAGVIVLNIVTSAASREQAKVAQSGREGAIQTTFNPDTATPEQMQAVTLIAETREERVRLGQVTEFIQNGTKPYI